MIDVIIPLYNASSTLEQTLMSLDIQTMRDDINVYLIDDYSSDKYDEIIEKFDKLKINYYRLEKNVGPAQARQKGIDISSSEYIMFLDADDYLYKIDSVQELYDGIKGYEYVMGYSYDEKRGRYLYNEGDLHGKLYSRKFIKDKNIKFNNSRFHEDNYFNNLYVVCEPKTKKLEEGVYIYRYNKNSITNDDKTFERLEILLKNIKEFLKEAKKRNAKKELILHLLVTKIRYLTCQYVMFNEEQRVQFEGWLEKYELPFLEYMGRLDYNNIKEELMEKYNKIIF